jgi:hypothetical protein
MIEPKTDYPPLLPGGLHTFDLLSLEALTVDEFPNSARRPALFNTLRVYLDLLGATGLRASIWVDGSFMCAKQEPDDIDLVVVYDPQSADELPESSMSVVGGLLNTGFVKARFGLHVFPADATLAADLNYWRRTFGTQRDEVTPKGLAELKVNHD